MENRRPYRVSERLGVGPEALLRYKVLEMLHFFGIVTVLSSHHDCCRTSCSLSVLITCQRNAKLRFQCVVSYHSISVVP